MACEKIQDLLSPYVDGELTPEARAEVDAHVSSCRECAELLSLLKIATDSLAAFPEIEPPPDLMAKLYAIPARKKRFRISLDFLVKPSLQPVFAAATVLLTLFSFYMFGPYKKDIDKTVNREIHRGYSQIERLYSKAGSVTDSLSAFANDVFVSLKKINPLGKNEE
jgi:Putative zinc-finger